MNKVFLNDEGLVEVIFEGKLTFKKIMTKAARLMFLIDNLPKNKKKINVLIDASKVTGITADALVAATDAMKNPRVARGAIFGDIKQINGLGGMLIAASTKENKIKIFDTRTQAEKWLLK